MKNFKYLDNLIHSGLKEIVLETDIILEDGEDSEYEEGIKLNSDDIIIDGNGHKIDACGKTRIFFCEGKNISLQNIRFENGCNADAGAIWNSESCNLEINNCTFRKNTAQDDAGAIANFGKITMKKVDFIENMAQNHGGAIVNLGEIEFNEADFSNNSAKGGGAIWNDEGDLLLRNSSLSNNSAELAEFPLFSFGGAIYNNGGNVNIKKSELSFNTAENGGAIFNEGTLSIEKSSLTKNSVQTEKISDFVSGGAIENEGELSITNCILSENSSQHEGGAIKNSKYLSICKSQLFSNRGEFSGAIENQGKLYIMDCILSDNSSQHEGGAIKNIGSIEIKNSNLIKNTADIGGAICNNAEIIIENSVFDDNASEHEFTEDIFNDGLIELRGLKYNNTKRTILNQMNMVIDKKIHDKIHNLAILDYLPISYDNVQNFTFLDQLIHCGEKDILLENDIILLNNTDDIEKYKEGIVIDVDDITIDGNGHRISSSQLGRIFKVIAKNVTIKNLTLEDGFTEESGGAIYNSGAIHLQDVKITNNIAREKGGAIHNTSSGNIEIDSCELIFNKATKEEIKNAKTGVKGGALFNEGRMKIDDSWITFNFGKSAKFPTISEGGAIYNTQDGDLTILNSKINNNATLIEGNEFNPHIKSGAVFNQGQITLNKCEIKNNEAGQDIITNYFKMSVFNCEIENNSISSSGFGKEFSSIISNDYEPNAKHYSSNLTVENSDIINNSATYIFKNVRSSLLTITNGKIGENDVEIAVLNHGKNCTITNTAFENNEHENKCSMNISSKSILSLKNPKIDDTSFKSILNDGKIIVTPENLEEIIDNHGTIKYGIRLDDKNDFTKLSEIIHYNDKEIILKQDYTFEEYEANFFEGGIELDMDGLTIDGQNHVLDGKGLSRIFIVTGKDITLKNIIFKNGKSLENYESIRNSCGGAIRTNYNSDLDIINCHFENNISEKNGGAITNSGELMIELGDMKENRASKGGAIQNWGELKIQNMGINNNSSKINGGAIHNQGNLTITNAKLEENIVMHDTFFIKLCEECHGGAIYNGERGNLTLIKSTLLKNKVSTDKDDTYDCNGGAISNFGTMKMLSSTLQNNATELGKIDRQTFSRKNTSKGGAIHNQGNLTMKDCELIKNKSIKGGAIWAKKKSNLKTVDCEFTANTPDDVHFDDDT